jgi:glutathione S-transferase
MRDGATASPAARRFTEAGDATAAALDGKTWLLGDQFTVADIVCVGVFGSAASRDLLEPWSVLRDYVERGGPRPAHAAAVQYAV